MGGERRSDAEVRNLPTEGPPGPGRRNELRPAKESGSAPSTAQQVEGGYAPSSTHFLAGTLNRSYFSLSSSRPRR